MKTPLCPVIFILLAVIASSLAALSCYQCNWSSSGFGSDDNCRTNPSSRYLRVCSSNPIDHNRYACSKSTGRNQHGEVVMRGCFPNGGQEMRCSENGGLKTCLCNNKDGCNGATNAKMSAFLLLMVPAVATAIFKIKC